MIFDSIKCISLPDSKDRREVLLPQLPILGSMVNFVEPVKVDIKSAKMLGSAQPPELLSLTITVKGIVDDFLESGDNTLLILEDDVVFTPDAKQRLDKVPVGLEWDVLYLGCKSLSGQSRSPMYPEPGVCSVRGAYHGHAFAINRRIAEAFYKRLSALDLPPDLCLQELNIKGELDNTYQFIPQIALQRPGMSTITHRLVDNSRI